ncbi:MAG: peptidoglycan D,D-transpeptidase FtsI family protein [Armatimonadota bacterium]
MKRCLFYIIFTMLVLCAFSAQHLCADRPMPSLQSAAERAVGTKSACVVAIDPRDGRILALVNKDMAYRKSYPPGSILKLLTAYAGLESGVLDPDATIDCRNLHKVDNTPLRCSLAGGHGKVDLVHALSRSCNVYFYKLGEKLGPSRLLKCFRDFGLGSVCGGDIADQKSGSVPGNLVKRVDIAKASIGQAKNLRVTALQMAVITSAIANGGIEYAPHLNTSTKPLIFRRIKPRPGTFDILRKGMRLAVAEGTAKRASVQGLTVCGKTGSPETEQFDEYRHGWFVGFAPYEAPEIVVVVFSEWGHGGDESAPIARKVLQAWLKAGRNN